MLKVTGRRRVSKMQVSGSAPIYPSTTNVAQPHYEKSRAIQSVNVRFCRFP